ncbi:unnamed protein product [Allacma fusca]|uniref:Integrase catalytic domain-containing protein n=1 Tax=Allacma fusca TaxID=39272 RepID=A0A8J2PT30_9HEXA|nr:unnamed protein product [Allacma fusca]
MSDQPQPRVQLTRPFTNIGVDFAGPVILRDSYSRSPKTHKAYIAVYVCMCTKAVHLELVSNLTSEAFLASLRRLVSTRGSPVTIKSDNGSNFIGANRELQEILKEVKSHPFNKQISNALVADGISWIFNPPAAPHMGGLWEAAVKSAKFHIHRVLKNAPLNFEEYAKVLKEIEACLNSRPLCPQSSDPDDLEALTPGHFIIGGPLKSIPEADLTTVKVNRLTRWQHQQQMKQQFWRRWHLEYLQHLQKRTKWKLPQANVKVGDLVVLREDHSPPHYWKLWRIEEVHPNDKDNKKLTRTVTVRTADGNFKRPITRLVLLPSPSENDSE